MGDMTVVESLTLEGVMQAPGRRDEDTRGGFESGGWALPYSDEVMFIDTVTTTTGVLIRTYRSAAGTTGG
jgi:hypothetical protein